jgi:hypothetical protein
MKIRALLAALLLISFTLGGMTAVRAEPDGWVYVASGISYQEFHLPDPNNVYVARMDRSNPNAIIESSLGDGYLAGSGVGDGYEPISKQADRNDEAVNNWGGTWGQRNRVVAAINGDFVDLQINLNQPQRGQIESGWYLKRFTDLESGSGFAWKLDRSAFIGECVTHPANKQFVTFEDGTTREITNVNTPRGANELVLYTPQFGLSTGTTSDTSAEVLVEMMQPTGIQPTPANAAGIVREIRKSSANGGNNPIPFGYVVLSGQGTERSYLINHLTVGDEIGISQFIKHLPETCANTPISLSWSDTYASIGGSFYYLKDGVVRVKTSDPQQTTRAPRTSIAMNDNYIFFIVVDGRNPGISVGMTIQELGDFAKNTLGATYAINQDGGGSSTMVLNGVVKNFPNAELGCYVHYTEQTYLPMMAGGGPAGAQGPAQPRDYSYATWPEIVKTPDGKCERAVVNGIMMVEVEPKLQSQTFVLGQAVITTATSNLRQGPGTNYAVLSTVPSGTLTSILGPLNALEGVFAKNAYWWPVEVNDQVGWMNEGVLAPAP